MKRRIMAFLLAFALMAGLLPGIIATPASAEEETCPAPIVEGACLHEIRDDAPTLYAGRPAYDGKLIDITPQRVEDTFNYLNEMYVQKHPEAALLVNTGTEEDRMVLKTLAEKITEGCNTDREKTNAVEAWLQRNIVYEIYSSAFASDTFYDRVGNCLSYANLMQFLLRSLGIPAVVGDGWRGNMAESTVDLFNYDGHAWCFVRLDGQWVMYDPLWLSGGTTDRDYMAKWVYFDNVEFVCPAGDEDNLPPETYDKPKAYYTNGRVYCWSESYDNTVGALFNFVNNQAYAYVTCQDDPETGGSDGWRYLYSDYDDSQMSRGDVYCDSWISYGDYTKDEAMSITYAHANGMTINGAVMTLDGIDYLMYTNQCIPILADKDDYSITDGWFTLKPGYTGVFLGYPWQDGCLTGNIISWENLNPEIATVDNNGIITCHAEGYAEFDLYLKRLESNGELTQMGCARLQVRVCADERIPDYSDNSVHIHSYIASGITAPTCTESGFTTYSCTCGDSYIVEDAAPLGHTYVDGVCIRCGTAALRVAGADRFDTAFNVADQMKETMGVEKFDAIVVASGAEFADALAGSYLAAVKEAPILLSYKAKQNEQVQAYIKENLAPGGTVYILGGTSAVPASMETGLQGLNVKRLAGGDRFETNLLILKEAGVKAGDEILVCTGKDFADSLSASATGRPILLVYKKLTDSQKQYLTSLKGSNFCIIGGENAVSATLGDAINSYGNVMRLAGDNRLITSVMVAQRYFNNPESAVVAYGWNFPDGLCGGPLAYAMKAPLILTYSKPSLYATAAYYTASEGITSGIVLGGEGLVSEDAVRAIFPVADGDSAAQK